jgi:hypothetical protein
MNQFPARIHVLLASQAPIGLVIRRGPSKRVATILWNRDRDDFQLGQWLKGRIYERRSDLSPGGKHFIYFAMNGKWESESKGSWTAVSHAPYLKALAMFPKGDCWNGGGLWTDKNVYWLNDGYGHSVLHDTKEVRRDPKFKPTKHFGGECPGVYYPRLLRDGWRYTKYVELKKRKEQYVFEKPLDCGWSLRKIAHAEIDPPFGKGCYWDEHQLVHAESSARIDCPDWEWVELDRKRLVWASGGKLFSGVLESGGLTEKVMLFDFNPMEFERIKAPY